MALVVKDRVQESSTTTGTGTLTLGGALTGFQTFSSAIGNGNTTYYAIILDGEWEVGIGTVGAGTLTRDTILESSNGGSLVNFSAGTKNVFCTYPAEKSVSQDDIGSTVQPYSPQLATYVSTGVGMRNRIINGAMQIDQRNAGASVTQGTSTIYVLDRFFVNGSSTPKFTVQQNAGSVAPPSGFSNYLGITSTSAHSVAGNESFQVGQIIEGFNVADLNWGSASAQPATLSFWVRSSLTGTFGGSIATTKTATWVMPFSYTISSANTWTYVTVPIVAPTETGGANTNNTAGVFVRFGLGSAGTAAGGTTGVWTNAGNYIQPSGTVSVVGTNGATFYITGVQLEKGSTATSFDYRPYGTELMLSQRYYQTVSTAVGYGVNSTNINAMVTANIPLRATPSFGITGVYSMSDYFSADHTQSSASISLFSATTAGAAVGLANFSGITTGRVYLTRFLNSNQITMSAEL